MVSTDDELTMLDVRMEQQDGPIELRTLLLCDVIILFPVV